MHVHVAAKDTIKNIASFILKLFKKYALHFVTTDIGTETFKNFSSQHKTSLLRLS